MRFISNRSTGYMGYRIAEEAFKRGHRVTLISGPTKLIPPEVNRFIQIQTTDDLLKVLKKETNKADCLIMCAAVSDFKPRHVMEQKIKRKNNLKIELAPNKDILLELARHKKRNLFVGFNLETSDLVRNARLKLKEKNLDIIVANRLTKHHNPFGNNKLDVIIIDRFNNITPIKTKNKAFISHVLLDKIERLWYEMNNRGTTRNLCGTIKPIAELMRNAKRR